MQLLVISDSHGKTKPIRILLDRYKNTVQAVVHLGDNAKDLLDLQPDYEDISFIAVAGNCDYYNEAPKERILTFTKPVRKQILLLHGHTLNVKMTLNRLMYYAQEKGVDACLFGHTHASFVDRHGPVFYMNPGSIGEPRGQCKASYGLLSIGDDEITGEVRVL